MSEYYAAREDNWDDGADRAHIIRYFIAKGFLKPDYFVVDYGCSTGYGVEILRPYCKDILGIDRSGLAKGSMKADLDTMEQVPQSDVSVCFEVLEHLKNPERLVRLFKNNTRKLIIVSYPNIQDAGENPWHLHNLTEAQLNDWIMDEQWKPFAKLIQGSHDIMIYYKNGN